MKIGDHDLLIKINHAREFLKEGNKVQFTLQFKGREMAHMDLGRALFVKIKQELFAVSKVEPGRDARLEGRRMTLVLQPDHKSEKQLAQAAAEKSGSPAQQPFGARLNIPSPASRPVPQPPAAGVAGPSPVAPAPVAASTAPKA